MIVVANGGILRRRTGRHDKDGTSGTDGVIQPPTGAIV
jgi:hypothetical protein